MEAEIEEVFGRQPAGFLHVRQRRGLVALDEPGELLQGMIAGPGGRRQVMGRELEAAACQLEADRLGTSRIAGEKAEIQERDWVILLLAISQGAFGEPLAEVLGVGLRQDEEQGVGATIFFFQKT